MAENVPAPADAIEYLDSLSSRIDQLPRSDTASVRALIRDTDAALSDLQRSATYGPEHTNGHAKLSEKPSWLRRRRG